MANKFHKDIAPGTTGHPAGTPSGTPPGGRDGTANWPGVPGKMQGKSRDTSGTKKLKQSAKEEGI